MYRSNAIVLVALRTRKDGLDVEVIVECTCSGRVLQRVLSQGTQQRIGNEMRGKTSSIEPRSQLTQKSFPRCDHEEKLADDTEWVM